MQRIDLERDELAKRLGGGFPKGVLAVIEGGSGAGKSVLAQRLTYGFLENGNKVAYVSTEFTTPSFLDQMEQLGYPVIDPFIEGEMLFVTTHPLMGHVVSARDLLPRFLQAKPLLQRPIVVVDAFSHLVEPHLDGSPESEEMLDHLVRTLKKITASGTTLILTVNPEHFGSNDASALMGAADIRLECVNERVGGQVDRYVVVRKFARATGSIGDIIPFRVEPGAGFIVEIKAVA